MGQYHTIDKGNLNKTMKVIQTLSKSVLDTNAKFLSYFSTTFNRGIAPGDSIWAPGIDSKGLSAENAPWRSPQIFREYLDDESLLSAVQEIPGINVTTARYSATTLENRAFGVKAGQKVEILLLQINSNIPTFLVLKSEILLQKQNVADLASGIASSDVLVSRILDFLDEV